MIRRLSSVLVLGALVLAGPAAAQDWRLLGVNEVRAGPVAMVCPYDNEETENFLCFTLGCSDGGPIHYLLAWAGGARLASSEVVIEIDGKEAGALSFTEDPSQSVLAYRAPYDLEGHAALIARLQDGTRGVLRMPMQGEILRQPFSLEGSSRALAGVFSACPMPVVPVADPGEEVLKEIRYECAQLGGDVAVEPGFVRREDLDGDGRDDFVVEYASAVCSEMASLYCGSGGCSVGFYVARDAGYLGLYTDVIRGYDTEPGGVLALDLHGSACGVVGYQACRRRFDVTGDDMVLLNQLTGEGAIAAMEAGSGAGVEPKPGLPEVVPEVPAPIPGPGTGKDKGVKTR